MDKFLSVAKPSCRPRLIGSRDMPSVEETTRYFDAHADRLRAGRLVDKTEALRDLLFEKLRPASRVMEVGAGTGLYTTRLLADGHRVVAVDLSKSCLDQIRDGARGPRRPIDSKRGRAIFSRPRAVSRPHRSMR